jgi:hypothetical protein
MSTINRRKENENFDDHAVTMIPGVSLAHCIVLFRKVSATKAVFQKAASQSIKQKKALR